MTGRDGLRNALWFVFVLALLATILGAVLARRNRPESLPLLGNLPAFELTERGGERVGLAELSGRPFVVDFIFTRCVLACPLMTSRMAQVGSRLAEGRDFRRVSISVDGAYDTPEVLAAFARRYQAPASWWFLTGDPAEIQTLSRNGFRMMVDPDTGDPANPIGHSTRFVLVDGRGRIRGYYDSLEPDALSQLDHDLLRLVRTGGR